MIRRKLTHKSRDLTPQEKYNKFSCYQLIVTIPKKTITKIAKISGYTLITFGVVTFLLPTASPVWIMAGCGLLGISKKDLLLAKAREIRGIKTGSTFRYIKQKLLLLKEKVYKVWGAY